MKTIIAGASGFIGQHLCSMLKSIGDEIITLSREDFITGKFDLLVHKLNGADRIFNLAGAPLNRKRKGDIGSERLAKNGSIF